jgi:hypothetical protein
LIFENHGNINMLKIRETSHNLAPIMQNLCSVYWNNSIKSGDKI